VRSPPSAFHSIRIAFFRQYSSTSARSEVWNTDCHVRPTPWEKFRTYWIWRSAKRCWITGGMRSRTRRTSTIGVSPPLSAGVRQQKKSCSGKVCW
jgi:hypothetical protein